MDTTLLTTHSPSSTRHDQLRLPDGGFKSYATGFSDKAGMPSEQPLRVLAESDCITVEHAGEQLAVGTCSLTTHSVLSLTKLPASPMRSDSAILAMLEALFACHPGLPFIELELDDKHDLDDLLASGAVEILGRSFISRPEMLFQVSRLWLGTTPFAYPEFPVTTGGIRHPVRPRKRRGALYKRFIPWIDQTLAFHVADEERDIEHFHRWMNEPRVAAIWDECGSVADHREFIQRRLDDPRTLPLIGTIDGIPFGYFELYWAKEDRLGPHYDACGHDRGWHVAIGENAFRGKAFVSAWLPSLMHYIFLADPRTARIVGEPIHHHQQQIRNLDRSGFAKIKHVDFPHKKALLVMLLRERFFVDRLLFPDLGSLTDGHGHPVIGSLARETA